MLRAGVIPWRPLDFIKSVPGAIGVKGYALYIPYQTEFADKEQWLNEPLSVSFTQDVGETRSHQVEVITAYDGGYENDGFEVPYTVDVSLSLHELEQSQSLPIGDLDGVLELSVREDGLGFEPTEWTIWLHPEHFVVKIDGEPGSVAMNQTWE